jgi:hypothetical protein
MSTVKLIKSDAQISITFGTPFIQKIQALMLYLTENHSVEELNSLSEAIKNQEELSEPWMEHLQTVITLLREIETTADKQGQTVETNVDDITKE